MSRWHILSEHELVRKTGLLTLYVREIPGLYFQWRVFVCNPGGAMLSPDHCYLVGSCPTLLGAQRSATRAASDALYVDWACLSAR